MVEFNKRRSTVSCLNSKSKKVKLDDPPLGEDVTSFSRHYQMLKLEYIKANPNKTVVQELMKVTFEVRRRDIENNIKQVKHIMQDYPFLASL